jgi:hypothetical protein
LVRDHDSITRKVRALVCRPCKVRIAAVEAGRLRDARIAHYLLEHSVEQLVTPWREGAR